MSLGRPRVHHRVCDSTNLRARALAAAGAPHGTLVTADAQTAGRGRQGRAWTAPAGSGVIMSLLLRRVDPLLSLAAGVAVADTVEALAVPAARPVAVKWPNDVWLDGRKVAGILVEGRPQEGWAVLGIGVNVAVSEEDFPPELRERATSLGVSTGDVEAVLETLLGHLRTWLAASAEAVLDAVRARDALFGRPVAWEGGSGVGAGIDPAGRLLVRIDGRRTEALDAGEVHLGALSG